MFRTLSGTRGEASLFLNTQFDDYFAGCDIINGGMAVDQLSQLYQGHGYVLNIPAYQVKFELYKVYQYWMAQQTLPPLTIFIDEFHLVGSRGSIEFPSDGVINADNVLGVILTTGRHANIRLVMLTIKPQLVDANAYRCARYHVMFEVDESDMNYFAQSCGLRFENPTGHDFIVV